MTQMEIKNELQKKPDVRIFFETLIIIGLVVILSFIFPQVKGIFELIPIAYFLVERRLRNRSFQEIGFKFKHALKDIKDNWHLVLLVAVVLQIGTLMVAKNFVPGFAAHVQSRVPLLSFNQLLPLFIMIIIGTFAEEITYRGLFQERLGWFMGTAAAIIVPSVIFSFMHYSAGSFTVVAYDIFTIFIDSIIYSLIYHRTKNIVASWISHFSADIIGVIAILMII